MKTLLLLLLSCMCFGIEINVDPDGYEGMKWLTPQKAVEKIYKIKPDKGTSFQEYASNRTNFDRLLFIDGSGLIGAYLTFSNMKISDRAPTMQYLTEHHGKSSRQHRWNIYEDSSIIESTYYAWHIGKTLLQIYFYEDTETHECSMICIFEHMDI